MPESWDGNMLENGMVVGAAEAWEALTADPPVAMRCGECGGPIFDGERYLSVLGSSLCERCADNSWRRAIREEEYMFHDPD